MLEFYEKCLLAFYQKLLVPNITSHKIDRKVNSPPKPVVSQFERATEVFAGAGRKDAKIGQLALENDFLEGALIKAGMLSAKR